MAAPEDRPERASKVQFVTVDEESSGQRLDNFLARLTRGVPKTRLYRALRKGEVRVNKGRCRAEYRVVAGDVVRIPPLQQASGGGARAAPARLAERVMKQIVFEDDDLMVIDKPSGLAVHGGSGLSFGLIETLRKQRPEARYLELVHRLDRDTSGLILVAKPYYASYTANSGKSISISATWRWWRVNGRSDSSAWRRRWRRTCSFPASAW